MHMLARLLAACSIVVFGPVAPASADPHVPPELTDPQSGFGFTDNPRCPRRFERCVVERPALLDAGTSRAACWLHAA